MQNQPIERLQGEGLFSCGDGHLLEESHRRMGATSLKGVDVSNWQGNIDWQKVKESGVSFAFCKATEGTDFVDKQFLHNMAEMKNYGIIPGAYHFARPKWSAIQQANHFVSTVKVANRDTLSGVLQLVLDLEATDGQSPSEVWSWTTQFINRILELTGRPAIIYVGYYFWKDNAGNSNDNLDCPLWLAAYVPQSNIKIPRAWTYWTFWQYTSSGHLQGISGNVDLDYFSASASQLQKLVIPEAIPKAIPEVIPEALSPNMGRTEIFSGPFEFTSSLESRRFRSNTGNITVKIVEQNFFRTYVSLFEDVVGRDPKLGGLFYEQNGFSHTFPGVPRNEGLYLKISADGGYRSGIVTVYDG